MSSTQKAAEYRKLIRKTDFYEVFVVPLVLIRDGHKCVKCKSEKNLDVHHKHYNHDKLSLNDLITLCRKCHKKEHRGAPHGK